VLLSVVKRHLFHTIHIITLLLIARVIVAVKYKKFRKFRSYNAKCGLATKTDILKGVSSIFQTSFVQSRLSSPSQTNNHARSRSYSLLGSI